MEGGEKRNARVPQVAGDGRKSHMAERGGGVFADVCSAA